MSASTSTSTSTAPVQTIAFLGATGGCTLPVLERALKAGHHATALVRNPAKLRTLLSTTRGVPADLIDRNLTIISGSASDSDAAAAASLRALLTVPNDGQPSNTLVDTIVSGIGSLPALQWSLRSPVTLQQPGLCGAATRNVVDALRGLLAEGCRTQAGGGPGMVAISTTGVSRVQRDVPLLFVPLYHYLLRVPHEDKRDMEDCVVAAEAEGSLGGFVVVRPSLLLDGGAKGKGAVRVGWEGAGGKGEGAPGPAVGYTVARDDVAAWIWEEAVMRRETWAGKCVSLTY
ncbi:fungal specific transcription factor domain-containing protein [Diplodia corticola]|uniref:Fungal specific transcription factor domain-containing protein n=1 Tax=Diplodia corticola TaxID=236234 RepID=A0A1J9RN19_9PEZI|nr:fungal specific transcription factor domain-containing protein [Diplodia corticola]OJD29316.1 fungal specific transcription factor domain-containing protein [Diplodia corticola]